MIICMRFTFRMWKCARFRLGLKGAQCKRIYLLRFAIAINIVTCECVDGGALLCLGFLCSVPFFLSLSQVPLSPFLWIFFCSLYSCRACGIPHYPFEVELADRFLGAKSKLIYNIYEPSFECIFIDSVGMYCSISAEIENRINSHPTTKLACITATRSSPALHQPVVQHCRTIRYPFDRGFFPFVFIHSCSFD